MTQELRKLAEAATQREWSAFIGKDKQTLQVCIGSEANGKRPCVVDWTGFDSCGLAYAKRKANAKYIAAANPAAILELLDRVEKAEKELSFLNGDLLYWTERAVGKGNANSDIEEAWERYETFQRAAMEASK